MKLMAAEAAPASKVNCRVIEPNDLEAVAKCLARGFPDTKLEDWRNGLRRLTAHRGVDGFSKYGHCLEIGGEIVGVLLLIYSRRTINGSPHVQCHLSSWCVDKEFRMFAPALTLNATKRKDVTYINISPARHTRKGIEALGYKSYVQGELLFAPLLSRRVTNTSIVDWDDRVAASLSLPTAENELLRDHHAMGCRAFIGLRDGVAHGFVSSPSRVLKGRLPSEQMLYFRDQATLVLFAGAIGAHFLKKLGILFLVDANGPIEGLVGRFLPGRSPRYYRGPIAPLVGDLANSELAMLTKSQADGGWDHAFRGRLPEPGWLRRLLDFGGESGARANAAGAIAGASMAVDRGNIMTVAFAGGREGVGGVSSPRPAPREGLAASAPAVVRRANAVRALTPGDIPAVAEMFDEVFRGGRKSSALGLRHDLEQVFLSHPDYDAARGALVMERRDGELGGFLGIIPVPFVFDGARLLGSVMSTWMIRDPRRDRGAGAALLRAHLGRSRSLNLVDTANGRSLTFARSLEMEVLTSHSLQWSKPLNYSGYALLRAAGSIGFSGAALSSWARRPEDWARRRGGREREAPDPRYASSAITPDVFAERFLDLARDSRLRPDWTPETITWMLSVAAHRPAPGALRLREVRDAKGALVGCYAFHAISGGRAIALQWLAREPHETQVLNDFIARARAENCVIVGGPTNPVLLRTLFGLRHVFYRHTCTTAVNSRFPGVTAAILAGQGLIGGLIGDRWTPLSTEV